MEERRRERRQRTLKAGRITIDPNASALDCIVRNLSPGGALLMVSSLAVPDHFALTFTSTRARHDCRVVWRAMDRVGVAFSQAS
jgi:hypothetical protein